MKNSGFQNTGNPVLDSFVNLCVGQEIPFKAWDDVHAKLTEYAKKEPGGLMSPLPAPNAVLARHAD